MAGNVYDQWVWQGVQRNFNFKKSSKEKSGI